MSVSNFTIYCWSPSYNHKILPLKSRHIFSVIAILVGQSPPPNESGCLAPSGLDVVIPLPIEPYASTRCPLFQRHTSHHHGSVHTKKLTTRENMCPRGYSDFWFTTGPDSDFDSNLNRPLAGVGYAAPPLGPGSCFRRLLARWDEMMDPHPPPLPNDCVYPLPPHQGETRQCKRPGQEKVTPLIFVPKNSKS